MADLSFDPRRPIDPAINSPGREGLTGAAPPSLYAPTVEREQITIAPAMVVVALFVGFAIGDLKPGPPATPFMYTLF